jgi:hypothetical protein
MKQIAIILYLLSCLLFLSCAYYPIPRSLDPESMEFLSKVRYLITKEERKTFLALPAGSRFVL